MIGSLGLNFPMETFVHACMFQDSSVCPECQEKQCKCERAVRHREWPCLGLYQISHVTCKYHASIHHVIMHAYVFCSGEELKKLFLESGGNFDLVEMRVKQWVENKKHRRTQSPELQNGSSKKSIFGMRPGNHSCACMCMHE